MAPVRVRTRAIDIFFPPGKWKTTRTDPTEPGRKGKRKRAPLEEEGSAGTANSAEAGKGKGKRALRAVPWGADRYRRRKRAPASKRALSEDGRRGR